MKPILVVLAAGMGSRYGGLKQIDAIGSAGEVLLDYSVYDALRAGFGKVVFIIRSDIEKDFRECVLARMTGKVPYELAWQEYSSLIPAPIFLNSLKVGRTKPWGTAHALLCAAPYIDAPFCIINSDDFYGKGPFDAMAKFLSSGTADGAIVTYPVEQTLSSRGTVTRGVCGVTDGYLVSIDEQKSIGKQGGDIISTHPDNTTTVLAADTPVSMNFWGFPASCLDDYAKYFDDFLASDGMQPKSECYIPTACDTFIKEGKLKFRVLDAAGEWFGVTYKEDKQHAIDRMKELTADGVYPENLWK
jgi:dTDP-glucose pyrophosphorylase